MGRFCAFLAVLAACGDNLPGPTAPPPPARAAGGGSEVLPPPRFVPVICGEATWPSTAGTSVAQDVAVAANVAGAAVLATPSTGGQLTGFTVDANMQIVTNQTKVPILTPFSMVGVSRIDNRTVATAGDGSEVLVMLLDDALQNPVTIGKLPGAMIAPQGMLTADGGRVVPIGGASGVYAAQFDNAWQPAGQMALDGSVPTQGFTAVQLGAALLVAWSTNDSCYTATVYTNVSALVTHTTYACPHPRIALGEAGTAAVVFEAPDGVRFASLAHGQLGGSVPLRAGASAPRVTFDGTRSWVSYIDERGDIVVGFFEAGQLVSAAISGTEPMPAGYEIVMMAGAPWVMSLDASGYTAHQLCVSSQ